MGKQWDVTSIEEVKQKLATQEAGLKVKKALRRQKLYDLKRVSEAKQKFRLGIFFASFFNPLIYVWLAAAAVFLFVGDYFPERSPSITLKNYSEPLKGKL